MTNDDLKALCERVAAIYKHADPNNLCLLANETLRLLAQCEAMRGALEWYADENNYNVDGSPISGLTDYGYPTEDNGGVARAALSQLSEAK